MSVILLSRNVARIELGDRQILYHQWTGRSAVLSPDALDPGSPAVKARLAQLGMLAEGPAPQLARMIPAHSRLVLLLPDVPALWLPLPLERTPGGHAFAERPLSDAELRLWRACNGGRTTIEVARKAGVDMKTAALFFADLCQLRVQALKLMDRPVSRRDPSLERLVAPDRPDALRPEHLTGPDGETDLRHYHRNFIVDGATHFDDRETTLAHALARPHPALAGEPYGARLRRALERRLGPLVGRVLEVGPGTGELARDWLAAGPAPAEYVRLDTSPELMRVQQTAAPGTRGVEGEATTLPFEAGRFDHVISNEVLADLSAAPAEHPDVATRAAHYAIAPLPPGSRYNLGAWKLVEEVARVLAPGGVAWLSEFGGPDEVPTETRHLDHPEVSIHFGHLLAVAQGVGLRAQLVPVPDLLELDLRQPWLSRASYDALRARCRAVGHHLEARAWTADSVRVPFAVEGLWDVPLSEPGPGPVATRFYSLLLARD